MSQPQPYASLLCARHENYQRVFDILNHCSQVEGFTLQILIGSLTNKFHRKCVWSAFYQSTNPNDLITQDTVDRVANQNPMCSTVVAKGQALSCSNGLNGISIIWQHNPCNCVSSRDFRLGETPSNKGLRTTLISNEADICAWVSKFDTQSFYVTIVQFDSNIPQYMLLSASLLLANLSNCIEDTFCDDTTPCYVFGRIFDFNKIAVMGVNKRPLDTIEPLGNRKGHFGIFQEQVLSQYKNSNGEHDQRYTDVKLEVTSNF